MGDVCFASRGKSHVKAHVAVLTLLAAMANASHPPVAVSAALPGNSAAMASANRTLRSAARPANHPAVQSAAIQVGAKPATAIPVFPLVIHARLVRMVHVYRSSVAHAKPVILALGNVHRYAIRAKPATVVPVPPSAMPASARPVTRRLAPVYLCALLVRFAAVASVCQPICPAAHLARCLVAVVAVLKVRCAATRLDLFVVNQQGVRAVHSLRDLTTRRTFHVATHVVSVLIQARKYVVIMSASALAPMQIALVIVRLAQQAHAVVLMARACKVGDAAHLIVRAIRSVVAYEQQKNYKSRSYSMNLAFLVARLLLATVFTVAGLAKLADRAGSRQALLDFGIPTLLVAPLAILLSLAEIAVAVTLVPSVSAWWGALGAFILLLLFVTGIGLNLARGRTPDCHCFGQIHSAPAGWPTLVRNGILAVVAGFIVWQGPNNSGPSAVSWLAIMTTFQIVGLIVGLIVFGLVVVEGWFLLHLLGQNGRLLIRIEALEAQIAAGSTTPVSTPTSPSVGLPIGVPAPTFQLPSLYGETMTLDALRASGKSVMLIFTDPGCSPCNALLPDLARWQQNHIDKLTIALISRGKPEINSTKSAEHGLTNILLQHDREVATAYQAHGTPSAVLIRQDGTIASHVAAGAEAIRALVNQIVGTSVTNGARPPLTNGHHPSGSVRNAPVVSGLHIGEVVPAIQLPDLDGRLVELSSFRGTSTLLLFWNPTCGFCSQMLPQLKAWEANPPSRAPKLLIISTGTVEANRAMGLTSPIVLNQNMYIGRQFGALGTPMAVLIDAEGQVASQVVAGAPGVMELARGIKHIPLTTQS